jgi:hypothetical protein
VRSIPIGLGEVVDLVNINLAFGLEFGKSMTMAKWREEYLARSKRRTRVANRKYYGTRGRLKNA